VLADANPHFMSMPMAAASALRPLPDPASARARLADIIFKRSFGYGEVKLASGRTSNFCFNLKPTMLDAEGAALLAQLTLATLIEHRIDWAAWKWGQCRSPAPSRN
jgi:hypothetical protein